MISTEAEEKWHNLQNHVLAAIEFNLVDRLHLFLEVGKYCSGKDIFYWNPGYKYLQKVTVDLQQKRIQQTPEEILFIAEDIRSAVDQIKKSSIFIIEGLGKVDNKLNFQLRNFYFEFKLLKQNNLQHQIFIVDEKINIPLELHSLVLVLKYDIPNIDEITKYLESSLGTLEEFSLSQACFGLSKGEIETLVEKSELNQVDLAVKIKNYKTGKLAGRGLRIVPEPDVKDVGGLDELDRDLQKINQLFSSQARERGLRPPKGCLLWGLPGTGKSLVAKMMSKKLNATLISCDWNELLESDLSSSLSKLQYVLDVVDNIGNCILFFDEFEKAFSGWNSNANGGILAKMAGKLLTWMQDHESPSIMLATINHLDMLPPELIRRFTYIWFFPSEMHNGAMWEVFKIHLNKHFEGLQEKLTDPQWLRLFLTYRGCSPDEIAKAIQRTHDEVFFTGQYKNIDQNILLNVLLNERKNFKPAITNKTTSNQLAKILMEADFARPVRGKDKSRFSIPPRELFEKDESSKIGFDEYEEIFRKIVVNEPNKKYSYNF